MPASLRRSDGPSCLTRIGQDDRLLAMATKKAKRGAKRKAGNKTSRGAVVSQSALRVMLETQRLELLAVFRALDRLGLMQNLPYELRELFELDAGFAEALWVLDQSSKRYDMAAMRRDTMASLQAIPRTLNAVLALLDTPTQNELLSCAKAVRASLVLSDAYLQIPGRDPNA